MHAQIAPVARIARRLKGVNQRRILSKRAHHQAMSAGFS